ncbi:AraC family transcriptional regulator N-terminal domain-containing protein [Paenibacillus sp. FSL P4-0338]|uniref:AraC family transcriptional regulator N-terminal domain-containing protein n=1 Tax=Paenibacillus sp. FSL P4-0338 TaxID=2921635 RepID=UPI0030FA10CF
MGKERFRYGPPHYLVASMDLPIIAEVLEASPDLHRLYGLWRSPQWLPWLGAGRGRQPPCDQTRT